MKTKRSTKPRNNPAARRQIEKILAPTDFSEESRSGVRYAVTLAEKLAAAVTLLYVIEPPARLAGVESIIIGRSDEELTALASKKLVALAKSESKSDLVVTFSVRTGKPFNEISTAATEAEADLIVIATHGYTGVEHVLLGSTTERVVRHAPCPVLTVPTRIGKPPAFRLKKILVPIDFSELANGALPWAIFLAAQFNAELVLLHVVEKFPIDYLLGRELMNEVVTPALKQAEVGLEQIAAAQSKSSGGKVSAVVREGKPYEAICDAAKVLDADLIVLTTHGYTGLKHVWLGSTAERVVRHAHRPVLVVRAPKPSA